jgi:hypothetical protein
MRATTFIVLTVCAALCASCAAEDTDEVEHDPADFEIDSDDGKGDGVAAVFNQNSVLTDALLGDAAAMTAAEVQTFFERSPYGTRSWLASYKVGGVPASQLVVNAAVAERIHPLVLAARMQVETSLVSKTVAPSQRLIDRALGCGCPDGGGCSVSYKGLDKQLVCAAKTLRRWYDASADGTGAWRKGVPKRTLDPRTVTPANHATATLYAYTPWVLVGSGGNWLVWNVTRKYVRHVEALGY